MGYVGPRLKQTLRNIAVQKTLSKARSYFKGNLAAFVEPAAGASTTKTCEKYSGWES